MKEKLLQRLGLGMSMILAVSHLGSDIVLASSNECDSYDDIENEQVEDENFDDFLEEKFVAEKEFDEHAEIKEYKVSEEDIKMITVMEEDSLGGINIGELIIPWFERTLAGVQRILTAHRINCLNPLHSSCSKHRAESMVKPKGGAKAPH